MQPELMIYRLTCYVNDKAREATASSTETPLVDLPLSYGVITLR